MENAIETPKTSENGGHTTSTNTELLLSVAESKGLRPVVDDIPTRVYAVAIIGFWEKFAFWGLTAPWQNYMENARHRQNGAPGALGLGQAMATRIYCAFYLFYYITPIFFAIVSDTRLGRFNTLCISAILYVLGCGVLVGSSADVSLDAGFGLPGLVIAMVLVALGGGAFKMLMAPFLADQYPEQSPRVKTLKSGERVVTDRALTIQYIYNMNYWVGNVGSLSWFATTFLENHYGFTLGYSITFASMVIAMLMLFFGFKYYIRVPAEGNVLPTALEIVACASQNGFKLARADPDYQREHSGKKVSWSSGFVDELRHGLRTCRILVAFVVYYICFDQMQNNLISQAKQMETHGLPNDMMPALNQVACILIGPVIQHGLYPFLTRRGINFGPIARMTVGFGFIALSMLYSAVVQHAIYSSPPCYNFPGKCDAASPNQWQGPNWVNVWVQSPLYVIMAIGEIFASVTALEYANEHSPKDMKAIVQAINLVIAGIGSACAMGLTPIARDPNLVILYSCLFGSMAATTVIFWWLFYKYDRPPASDACDNMAQSKRDGDNNENLTHKRGFSVLRLRPTRQDHGGDLQTHNSDQDPERGVRTTVTANGVRNPQALRERNAMSMHEDRNSILVENEVRVDRELVQPAVETANHTSESKGLPRAPDPVLQTSLIGSTSENLRDDVIHLEESESTPRAAETRCATVPTEPEARQ